MTKLTRLACMLLVTAWSLGSFAQDTGDTQGRDKSHELTMELFQLSSQKYGAMRRTYAILIACEQNGIAKQILTPDDEVFEWVFQESLKLVYLEDAPYATVGEDPDALAWIVESVVRMGNSYVVGYADSVSIWMKTDKFCAGGVALANQMLEQG